MLHNEWTTQGKWDHTDTCNSVQFTPLESAKHSWIELAIQKEQPNIPGVGDSHIFPVYDTSWLPNTTLRYCSDRECPSDAVGLCVTLQCVTHSSMLKTNPHFTHVNSCNSYSIAGELGRDQTTVEHHCGEVDLIWNKRNQTFLMEGWACLWCGWLPNMEEALSCELWST